MEKKKQIKISLGTAICIFIIVLLLIALVWMYIYFNKDNIVRVGNESEIQQQKEKELYEVSDFELINNTLTNEETDKNTLENTTKSENDNVEIKDKYVGIWNTEYAFTLEGTEVDLYTLFGTGYINYGSKLILNEDGTFKDMIQPIQSNEFSNTGRWECYENMDVSDMIRAEIVLKYDDGREEHLDASRNVLYDPVLSYLWGDDYELRLCK